MVTDELAPKSKVSCNEVVLPLKRLLSRPSDRLGGNTLFTPPVDPKMSSRVEKRIVLYLFHLSRIKKRRRSVRSGRHKSVLGHHSCRRISSSVEPWVRSLGRPLCQAAFLPGIDCALDSGESTPFQSLKRAAVALSLAGGPCLEVVTRMSPHPARQAAWYSSLGRSQHPGVSRGGRLPKGGPH